MVARVTPAGTQVTGTKIPTAFGNGVAGGWLGQQTITADQTVSVEVTVTGTPLTVTVNANRRIKLSFDSQVAMSSGAGNRAQFRLKESTTVLQDRLFGATTNASEAVSFFVVITPSAGSHTYALSLQSADAGNAVLKASATSPTIFLAEDIGPA